jgi:hypothetical protein
MPVTDRGVALRGGAPAVAGRARAELPRWFAVGLTAALALVAGFGLVGLALAVVGAFIPGLVVPLGAAASALLFRGGRSGASEGSTTTACQLTAAGAVALAVGSGATSIRHAGEHVLIDRDPGAYLNTGRWLATHSGLVFRADIGAFRGTPGLAYGSPAVDGHGPTMHFQFAHLLGVLIAEARWLGGDRLMFAVVPILGALSIAVFFAVASRFVRPQIALVAAAALACNVVQLHFSRDAYSEILQQLVLLGSVWLLSQSGLDRRRSLIAGVLLGTTVAARIDGPLYLAALPVVVGMALSRRSRGGQADADDGSARLVGAFGAGVAVVVVLAAIDVAWRSPEYARDIGIRVVLPYGALVAAIVVAAFLARRAPRLRPMLAARPWLPSAVGAACVVVLLAEWLVRPYVQQVRGSAIPLVGLFQPAEHLAVDPTRRYFENSLRWFAWYVGPPALAAGIVGAGCLVRDTLRRGAGFQWVLTMAFTATGAVYLWNANALPDQLWVMRRFVPIVLPGFVLCAALTFDWLVSRCSRWGSIAGGLLGVGMLAWPISATAVVPDETAQASVLGAVNATCRTIGRSAAVVVISGANSFDRIAPQAIRSFCGVPVAIRRPTLTAAGLEALAQRVRADGRTLYVLSDTPARITAVVPGARVHAVATIVDTHELTQTLNKPPRSYWTKTYSFAVGEVPARARVRGGKP